MMVQEMPVASCINCHYSLLCNFRKSNPSISSRQAWQVPLHTLHYSRRQTQLSRHPSLPFESQFLILRIRVRLCKNNVHPCSVLCNMQPGT